MSEHSSEADRVDESAYGVGGETSAQADVDAGGGDAADVGGVTGDSEGADEAVADSHAADVDAGYDDASDSPATGGEPAEEDGSF